jgi:hypothetical protein
MTRKSPFDAFFIAWLCMLLSWNAGEDGSIGIAKAWAIVCAMWVLTFIGRCFDARK